MSEIAEPNKDSSTPSQIAYWWVNQKPETYKAEKAKDYLFAPPLDKAGKERIQYNNMTLLKPGDIVLHYSDRAIRAISKVVAHTS